MKTRYHRRAAFDRATFNGTVLALAGLFLVHSSKTIDPDVLPRFVYVTAVLGVALLLTIINVWRRREDVDATVVNNRVTLAWLLGVIVAGASILVAINRPEAVFQCARLTVFFIFFVFLVWLISKSPGRIESFASALALLCLGLSLVGVIELAGVVHAQGWGLRSTYLVRGLSGHRNFLAQTLLLTLPFALYGALIRRGLKRAVLAGAAIVATVLVVVLMVRSVWLASAVGAATTGSLWMLRVRRRSGYGSRQTRRRVWASLVVLLVIAVVLVAALGTSGRSVIAARLQSLANPARGSAGGRLFLWRQTFRMVRDHPLLGVGGGNWRIVFPRYASNKFMMRDVWKTPRRPHNDYLWILAERGPAGLMAYLTVVATLLWWVGRAALRLENQRSVLLALAVFFSESAYLTFSFFSFPSERIGLSVVVSIVFAMACGMHLELASDRGKIGFKKAIVWAMLALILTAASGFSGALRMRSEEGVKLAYRDLRLKHYRMALTELDRTASPLYTVDRSGFPVRLYRAAALDALGYHGEARSDLIKARRASPFNVVVLDRLALSFARLGNTAEAMRAWQEALQIHPEYPPAVRGLAVLANEHRHP